MPCNTISTSTVDLEKVENHDLLEAALKSEFGAVQRRGDAFRFVVGPYVVNIAGGRASSAMSTSDLQVVVGRVKQAYSRHAVMLAAKRFGWSTIKGADANHFSLVKGF
jgi:hypothetical protein